MSESIEIDEIYDSDISYEDSEEIEYIKHNLIEPDIIRFNKNNLYKMNSNNKIKNESFSRSDDLNDKEYYKSHEQINEVKYNIIMKIFNECKFDETKYSSVIRAKDKTFRLRRLVVQDFNINENKIIFGEKNYSFIPINEDSTTNCQFYLRNNAIDIECFDKKIKKLMINNNEIKGFSNICFQNEYKIDIPKKIKSKGGSKKSQQGKKSIDNTSKHNNQQTIPLLDNNKNDAKSDNQNVIQKIDKDKLIATEDSYKEEYSGDSLYVKYDNNNNKDEIKFTRYYFLEKYEKEIDGIYTSHKDINLNINSTIDFPNLKENIYIDKPKNDLYGCIIFKNFESNIIHASEPIILEIKSGFSLFDLMSQIKQISKILNNTSKKKEYMNLPRYVIGILCNHDPISGDRELTKLNIPYFNDEKKTFLNHAINVIKKNKINVVICVIKGEINGYPLGKEDYEIENAKLKYRVDFPYMYKKIAGKDIGEEKLKELKNNLNEYRSINSQKMHYMELTDEEYQKMKEKMKDNFQNNEDEKSTNSISLENANKIISELENKSKEFENKNKELENEKKELENKNKELENEKKEFENKSKEFENKSKEFENKSKEFENKSKEFENKNKEFENKNKELENEKKELENKSKEFENKNKELENKNKELEIKISELMKKLNEEQKQKDNRKWPE